MLIRGSDLGPKLQAEVKAAYVHRFTGEHKPGWVTTTGAPYRVQFKDDADWLANTFFHITKQGELNKRIKHCESHPTWPEGMK